MFRSFFNKNTFNGQEEKEKLNNLSEKELLVELIIELKKVSIKCDDIARKIVIWSD